MAFFSYIFWAIAQAKSYLQMVHLNKDVTNNSVKFPLNIVIISYYHGDFASFQYTLSNTSCLLHLKS